MTFHKNNNLHAINMYLWLDFIIYNIFVLIMGFYALWFTLWITGIYTMVLWLYNLNAQYWFDFLYLCCFMLIIGATVYIFSQLLEYMEQNWLVINNDRLILLQKNMDLMKENKEIKMVLKNMMQNISEEDKKYINNL